MEQINLNYNGKNIITNKNMIQLNIVRLVEKKIKRQSILEFNFEERESNLREKWSSSKYKTKMNGIILNEEKVTSFSRTS